MGRRKGAPLKMLGTSIAIDEDTGFAKARLAAVVEIFVGFA